MDNIRTLFFVLIASSLSNCGYAGPCFPESKTLEKGQKGIIKCECNNLVWLSWYDGNDTITIDPFIYIDQSGKYGDGYLSGEYDIRNDDSLVITNVSSTTFSGIYSVVMAAPGDYEPRIEHCNVDIHDPEKDGDGEKVTGIATDDPERATTHAVSKSHERVYEMVDARSFQAEIDHLKALDQLTLCLLVIVLIAIGIVIWKIFTATYIKNPKDEEEKGKCQPEFKKKLLVVCRRSFQHGDSRESANSSFEIRDSG